MTTPNTAFGEMSRMRAERTSLRLQLLGALQMDDDGRVLLAEYVDVLVRQRDEARDVAMAERNKLAEALEKLARTEELWMRDSEVAKTGIEDTIRHHHQINALEQRLADALKIADDNAAEASAAWHEAARLTAERDQARRTAERLAADGPCYDQAPMIIGLSNSAPPALCILRAGHAGAHRAERGMTWVPTEPDTALTDLQATVKRMRADYARIEEHREQLLSQMEEACADRDRARREAERFTAVQRLSQQLTRELEQIRADAAVLREDCDVLDDKAARWHKQAKKRLRQRDEAREQLDLAEKHVWDLEQQLARMSPVVEAALEWRGEGLPVPDYALVDEEIALRDAVTAYQAATVVGAKPADTLPAEQVSPVTQNAETEPRVWQVGDSEPGPEVTAVEDEAGDIWTRVGPEWQYDAGRTLAARWRALAAEYGPLTDATPQDTTSPAGATQDGEDVADACQVPDETETAQGLTTAERAIVYDLGQIWCRLRDEVVGHHEWTRAKDLAELVAHIHALQQAVMSQAAGRAHPGEVRLLGERLGGQS